MSFLSWLWAHLGRPPEVAEPPDLHATHAVTERSRQERRRTIQRRRELMVQIHALEKEIDILRDRRGSR